MKWSRFNFLTKCDDNKYVLYNSYTNNLMEIDETSGLYLEQLKSGNFKKIDEELINELKDENILVDDDDDDLIYQKVKLSRLNTRFRSDIIYLTIVPSLACNFSCPYCFESEVNERKVMTDSIQADLIDYIKSLRNLHHLSIDWYGGEPLLAFDIISSLMNRIRGLDIDSISSTIITNGYLLDANKILQLKALGLNRMQITIDGLESTHNQRRPHKTNSDSFQKIIENIILIDKLFPELEVNIRVNIDKNNEQEFFAVNEYISKMVTGQNIYTYPAYVTDYTSCNTSQCLLNRIDQAEFALSNADKYPFEKYYYPRTRISECTARYANSFVIGPDGALYRCWCDVGNREKICGTLKDGIINTNLYTKYMTDEDPLFDKDCRQCSYFPICDGGCVLRRFNNHGNKDYSLCTIQKEYLEGFMKLYRKKHVII